MYMRPEKIRPSSGEYQEYYCDNCDLGEDEGQLYDIHTGRHVYTTLCVECVSKLERLLSRIAAESRAK